MKSISVCFLLLIFSFASAQTESAELLLKIGIQEYDNDNFKESVKILNKVIAIDPKNEKAYYTRGRAFHELKQYVLAINDFTKAIEIDPKYQKAYYIRGFTRYLIQNYQGAIEDFSVAIELNPISALSYSYRGECRYALGDKKEACEDWIQASELGYTNAHDLINAKCEGIISTSAQGGAEKYITDGDIKFSGGDYDGALADYISGLEINPENGYAYLGIGMVRLMTGDKTSACIAWHEAAKLGNHESKTFIEQHCK